MNLGQYIGSVDGGARPFFFSVGWEPSKPKHKPGSSGMAKRKKEKGRQVKSE